jgi:hypothetical protein
MPRLVRTPSRLVNVAEARARHGAARVEALAHHLFEGDPPADAAVASLEGLSREARTSVVDRVLAQGVNAVSDAPDALCALVASVSRPPLWVDDARVARGGDAFLRSGLLGGIVLGAYSLVLGYCSPAGNKPLVYSGRLDANASRRLAETSRFVQAVTRPGGMARYADGFAITLRVRLMHAAVRRMLQRSPVWREEDWGVPINQADMAGTVLLFSMAVHDGLARLGMVPTPQEREDLLHLWRYNAFVMGVRDELRCATLAEARAYWDLLTRTQAPPDEDSKKLARSLIESPVRGARTDAERRFAVRTRPLAYAVSRHLLGDHAADLLGYPRSPAELAVMGFQQLNQRAAWVWRGVRDVPFGTVEAGTRYWDRVVRDSLRGEPATFGLPAMLTGVGS